MFSILNSPSHLPVSSQCTRSEHPVSCIEPELAIYFTYDNIHVLMLFSQIIPLSPSPTESKSLFFTSHPSPSHLPVSSQCTRSEHPVSCIKPELAIYFTYDNIHVLMLFSQIIPFSPSPTESKSLFFTSVSLLLPHI